MSFIFLFVGTLLVMWIIARARHRSLQRQSFRASRQPMTEWTARRPRRARHRKRHRVLVR